MKIGKRNGIIAGSALVLILAAGLIVWMAFRHDTGVAYKAVGDTLTVGNEHYEIGFQKEKGAISYVLNKETGKKTELANRSGALWWGILDDDTSVGGNKADSFAYRWNRSKNELTFEYGGKLQVEVVVGFGQDNRIRMSAKVTNHTGGTLESFRFPYELKLPSASIQDGLLPLLPGAKLKTAFFRENNSYEAQYPGTFFASYLALNTESGPLALYDLVASPMSSVDLGFKTMVDDPGKTGLVHNYKLATAAGGVWNSPTLVLEVGGDYADSIASYRELNGIDRFRSLADKLGKDKDRYLAMPFLKMDVSAIPGAGWTALKSGFVDKLTFPSVLHLVGFQTGGHDENYPDFLPADAKWGTDAEFQAFVRAAKTKGDALVPYTNFSWWGIHSPTLTRLPAGTAIEDIAVNKVPGVPVKEDYGVHSGYVMNMADPYVTGRIAEEHKKLLDAGMDGIFEDQWGIRDVPYTLNRTLAPGTDASSSYYAAVRSYFASLKHPMYTEDGFDMLVGDSVGFMGSNYLWDLLGYRAKTATYSEYYPMIGMLARDKVMLFQHNLAAETMTDKKEMLRWNAAMGYHLSADLFNGIDNPWVDLVGLVQKEVLAKYGDARVKSFEPVAADITRTDFGSYTVLADWNADKPFEAGSGFTLAPSGFEILGEDGGVRAGAYSVYNGVELGKGDHIVVELRSTGRIRLYQPVGSDTTLAVKKPKDWKHAAAAAYTMAGEKLADIPATEQGDSVRFDFIRTLGDKKAAYVELTASDNAVSVADFPYKKVKELPNLAFGKKVQVSSMASADFPGEKVLDGDPYTYWESTAKNFPQTLTLDLGGVTDIGKLVLKLPPQDAWATRNQTIEVQVSQDGQTFTTAKTEAPYSFDPKRENRVDIPLDAAKAQAVRLVVSANTGWPAAQLAEVEVYAPE
ncbi:discoidin domain-containing protein [Gorillibacterium sp. sgz500922]|uniref:discoidin domain-containing protein n=1 Tax=Gorillibacterium sp. sgz500922 TaxID=3446694 RepID=UPI003F6723FD